MGFRTILAGVYIVLNFRLMTNVPAVSFPFKIGQNGTYIAHACMCVQHYKSSDVAAGKTHTLKLRKAAWCANLMGRPISTLRCDIGLGGNRDSQAGKT